MNFYDHLGSEKDAPSEFTVDPKYAELEQDHSELGRAEASVAMHEQFSAQARAELQHALELYRTGGGKSHVEQAELQLKHEETNLKNAQMELERLKRVQSGPEEKAA